MSYLEANLEVIAELRAATHLTVETLVDEAVELIGAIATVIVAVTQQGLIQTLAVTAHEGWFITPPLWNHGQMAGSISVTLKQDAAPVFLQKKFCHVGRDKLSWDKMVIQPRPATISWLIDKSI